MVIRARRDAKIRTFVPARVAFRAIKWANEQMNEPTRSRIEAVKQHRDDTSEDGDAKIRKCVLVPREKQSEMEMAMT